jgi:hypothetical protein
MRRSPWGQRPTAAQGSPVAEEGGLDQRRRWKRSGAGAETRSGRSAASERKSRPKSSSVEAEEKSSSTAPATVPAAATPSAAPPHRRHRAAPPRRPVGVAVSGDPPALGPLESRSDTGARETQRESRVRGRRNGEGKAEVRSCGRERGRSGRWRGEWSSFRDPAGPLVGAGGRRGSACGSAGRTRGGRTTG